ncbi:transferrin-like [Vespula maculifrons]|uniref:Transferrin n=1 Tax=Vespula maculifrons TaxID=7453 RepID=A0ABD2CGB9_VESMC
MYARDRYKCIEKVSREEIDVVVVDPEDIYLTALDDNQTKEEAYADYHYEAVAVIQKDLNVSDGKGLRHLKSCHTGIQDDIGYNIPLAKLAAIGDNINNTEYFVRDNEFQALSLLFSKACLVETWSSDPTINRKLTTCAHFAKSQTSVIIKISIRVTKVLFVTSFRKKIIYIKRFFGLPVGVTPAVPTNEDPSNFRYFCPDGTKVPINADTKPCTWAARPWQGYMANDGVNNIEAVQKELTELGQLGEKEKAAWWKDLMLLDEKTLAVASSPISPEQHLKDAKYLDVIERNSGAPERNARLCVWTQDALNKYRALSRAAHSRDARPRLSCLLEKDQDACLIAVRDDGADLVVVDGGSVLRAITDFNAQPIISEVYGSGSTKYSERPAVVIVKKGSSISGLADLRGKRSCHSGYRNDFAGWLAPIHALKKANLIKSEDDVAEFFAGSCAPGAQPGSKLCQQCVGNIASNDDKVTEATKCLTSDKGDVAFLPLPALMEIDKKNESEGGVKTSDFMLVCPNGGLAPVEEWSKCNLGLEPPRIILSSAGKTVHALDELKHGVLAASTIYSKKPDLLQLSGS